MTTTLEIDDALQNRVQNLASQRRRPAQLIILEAIEQYVPREEARESFKQEALAAWSSYLKTGRHLTGQEARDWLKTWGTEEETAAPACHD